MGRLLNRNVTVTFTKDQSSLVVRDLHVRLDVVKTGSKEPNALSMNVTNLAPTTRAFLQEKGIRVLVDFGYRDNPQSRLFTGDMIWSHSTKMRAGWDTLIQAADGLKKFRDVKLAKSFRRGTTALRALEELTKAMGLTVPKNARVALSRDQFLAGMTVSGPAAASITKILDRVGLSWSIQDDQIQILAPTEVAIGEAVLVAQSTGMIGSPQLSPPTGKSKRPILTAQTLVEPRLTPGGLVAVRSLSVTGDFKLTRVAHDVDSKGGDAVSTMEAELL
jgi:hypothetical protein